MRITKCWFSAESAVAAFVEGEMKITLIQEVRPYEFKWWSGTIEPYDTCRIYRVDEPPPELLGGEIAIAWGWRPPTAGNGGEF